MTQPNADEGSKEGRRLMYGDVVKKFLKDRSPGKALQAHIIHALFTRKLSSSSQLDEC